jgi:hypothetical protein
MPGSFFSRVTMGLAATVLASGVARADQEVAPGYRCTAEDFRYVEEVRDEDSRDRWVTRIGFTKDGKLTWSVDAKWDHPGEGFLAKGSTTVTLDGFGLYLYAEETGHAEQVGEDFPSVQFEPLNYGVYPKMRGLITPVTADVYQGCPEEPPPGPSDEPPAEPPTGPTTARSLTVHACSDLQLPIFGGDVAMPSVPRYVDRTFCAAFNFASETVDGIVAPAVSDAIFSPVDFVDLSRTGSAKTCRYSKSTCSTSASCEPSNPCVPDPERAGSKTCALGYSSVNYTGERFETTPGSNQFINICRTDDDCEPDQCEFPTPQRPTEGTLYGIRLTIVTSGSVEVGDEQRLAELMEPMWNRRSDATARGVVFNKVLSERYIGDAKVERTMLYLFELTAGSPMTFVTRWD